MEGNRIDVGFYLSADYTGVKSLDIVGGIRFDTLSQKANPGGGSERLESKKGPVTGFFALSYRITDSLTAFANVSRAYRTPGLSELFYSGITGRGFIIAQPGLTPEMSVNGDAGLRFISRRFFGGIYAFLYSIDGLIDRFLVAERTYTYGNLEDVRIQGLELEVEYYPFPGWKIFGNLFALNGESRKTGLTVNDIPPFRVFLGSQIWYRKLSFEANLTFQAKKDNPGPAEVAIPAYEYVQLRAGYNLSPVAVFCLVQNALNKTFLGRPDPSAVLEPARSFVIGVRYAF
jgi:iron complex outermembrane receptor protein